MSSFIKKSCYVVTILLLTVFYFYVSTERSSFTPEINQQTISNHNAHAENPKKLKRILYWNDYYGSRNFGFCCGRGPYIKHKCLNSQCYTSKDRKEDLESFDAIVFHGRSLDIKDVPKIRYPHQLYVFLTIESAAYPGIQNFSHWDNFFNLTMTYRRDSDVFMPYGKVVAQRNKDFQIKHWKKRHLVSWMVSNCKTNSRREILVDELKQYLPKNSIHVYGKCGTMNCPKDSPDARDGCWKMMEKKYKFYLALENSLCPDYVTEKMFEALKHEIVPIVLGGSDYQKMFPEKSFINMMDFNNMSSLADYLVKLDNDDHLYNELLTWKSRYSIKNSRFENNQCHCDLCNTIHQYNTYEKRKIIKSLEKWFIEEKPCVNPSWIYVMT